MSFQNAPLKIKITGLVLFSILVSYAVFQFYSTQRFSQALELALAHEMAAKAKLVARDVDRFMAQRLTDARILASSAIFSGNDLAAISLRLKSVAHQSEWINKFHLLDLDGRVIACSGEEDQVGTTTWGNYPEIESLFVAAKHSPPGEVFVLETQSFETVAGAGLLLLTPVATSDRLLLVEINLHDIEAILADFAISLAGSKHVYLVRNDGTVMATNNPAVTPYQKFPDLDRRPDLLEFFSRPGAKGHLIYTDIHNDPIMAGFANMDEFGANRAPDWSIIATADQDLIMAPVRQTRQALFWMGLMLTSLMTGFAYLVARSITTPLEKTIAAIKQIQDGTYSQRLAVEGGREIISLADAFNHMAEKVEQRTSELSSTNRQLQTEIAERLATEKIVWRQANYDTLTGLPNRTLFNDRLEQTISHSRRSDETFFLLFMDLDRFKGINDTFGHSLGDQFLKTIAERLEFCLRDEDTVARLGGDEFVMLIPDLHQALDVTALARRILETMAQPVHIEGREFINTASIGIASYPGDGDDLETLLRNADIAMYAAKDEGRNTFHFFSEEMNARVAEKLNLEAYLRRALEKEELFLVYQPQFDVARGAITGVEALLRWQHPHKGLLGPEDFIPLTEETGLILPIGEWVLRTACRQAVTWHHAGFPSLRMGVNLSGRQFQKTDFTAVLDQVLEETGIDPATLELEITETVAAQDIEHTIMTLVDCKSRNVRLAIDDFGTGHSSLSYLKNFPFDRLKIDREFVRDIPQNADDAKMAETIITMANNLGLEVIAEGVETEDQVDFLRRKGCTEMQGFHLARPMPAEKVLEILKEKGFTRP